MSRDARPLAPGAVIGLMGGGQLGRMTAMAARALGFRVHALDPSPHCPASGLCDRLIRADLNDPEAARELASSADVVTCEREDVGPSSLAALHATGVLRPGADVLRRIQDRALQKDWLARRGVPVGAYRHVESAEALAQAIGVLGHDARLKRCRGGFDGRAQWRAGACSPQRLWQQTGEAPLVVERNLDLQAELSVLVARGPDGAMAVFPVAYNVHERGTLELSVMPAPLPEALTARAVALARRLAEALQVVGLLAVELFWTRAGRLLVNELAARPHNTFHTSEWACATSQFEQLVRAICGLPLGPTEVVRPAAITNVFGDLWLAGRQGELTDALHDPRVHLRLYDKAPRARRKLGHIAYVAPTSGAALAGADALRRKLAERPPAARTWA